MRVRKVILWTPEQREEIREMLSHEIMGDAILSQSFSDGVHCVLITKDEAEKLCQAINDIGISNGREILLTNSALHAYYVAKQREERE